MQLQLAKDRGQKVFLSSHIPPGWVLLSKMYRTCNFLPLDEYLPVRTLRSFVEQHNFTHNFRKNPFSDVITLPPYCVSVHPHTDNMTFAWWRHSTTTTRMHFAAIFVMQCHAREIFVWRDRLGEGSLHTLHRRFFRKNTEYSSLPQSILVVVVKWRHHANTLLWQVKDWRSSCFASVCFCFDRTKITAI